MQAKRPYASALRQTIVFRWQTTATRSELELLKKQTMFTQQILSESNEEE